MEDKTVYISGPIGNAGNCSPEQIIKNVELAEDIYGELIKKGYAPYCPHMSYYPDKRWREAGGMALSHAEWLNLDKKWVKACKYFYYMTPEKYGESRGAKMEFEWAKGWGKKIFTSIEEIPDKIEITV